MGWLKAIAQAIANVFRWLGNRDIRQAGRDQERVDELEEQRRARELADKIRRDVDSDDAAERLREHWRNRHE